MTATEARNGLIVDTEASTSMIPRSRPPTSMLAAQPAADPLPERRNLLDRLRRSTIPIVVVDAPAGYGKSTVVQTWTAGEARPVHHIALDESHNDPAYLLTCILDAVDAVAPLERHLDTGPMDDPEFLTGVVIPRLRRILQERVRPVVVVLDGTDVVHSVDAWAVLTALLESAPAETCFVLVGRTQPPLPLGVWVTHRRALWLRRGDLTLDPVASRALLVTGGVPEIPAVLDLLVARCAGWAAGLRAATEFVLTSPDPEAAARAFSGGSGAMREYLRRTMLDVLPVSTRQFLSATSLLTELSGERCDAVLSTTGSGTQLEELSRANLLVDAVEYQPDLFRYHPLLRDLLVGDLRARAPESEPALHRRAGQSYEQEGAVEQALGHARSAGDTAFAADLIWSQVAVPRRAGDRPLDRWLDTFTTTELLDSPRLALASAWRAMETGRPLEHWLSAAARVSRSAPGRVPETPVLAGLALFRAVLARDGVGGMAADADLAVEQSGDDAWRCLGCHLAGVARLLLGDREGANRWLIEGQQLSRLLGVPSVEAQCTAHLAVMALEDEDWGAADRLTEKALQLIERFELQDEVTMTTAYVASAAASARRGDRIRSEQSARNARQLLARTPAAAAPWRHLEARLLLARAHLLLGDPRQAGALVDEAERITGSTGLGTEELGRKLLHLRSMVGDLPETVAVGPTGITAAELRVLRLLPTHLSFQEIGSSVYLSRNTVKTQAIAAYRKLGVNSRAEAVACARTLGLLDHDN